MLKLDIPDKDKVEILKGLLVINIASHAITLVSFYNTIRRFEKATVRHRQLYQVTKILLDNADLEDPKLNHELAVYQEFINVVKNSGMGPDLSA